MFPSNDEQSTVAQAKPTSFPGPFSGLGTEVGRSRSRREGKEGKELEGRGESYSLLCMTVLGCSSRRLHEKEQYMASQGQNV